MALRQKYIEYHTFNVNTCSDLTILKEELQQLLNNQFTLSVTVNACNYSSERCCSNSYDYSPWRSFPEELIKTEVKKEETNK